MWVKLYLRQKKSFEILAKVISPVYEKELSIVINQKGMFNSLMSCKLNLSSFEILSDFSTSSHLLEITISNIQIAIEQRKDRNHNTHPIESANPRDEFSAITGVRWLFSTVPQHAILNITERDNDSSFPLNHLLTIYKSKLC